MTITVGSSLFCFTDEWRGYDGGLTGLLEQVAAFDLGPDIEVVGMQSFRGLPEPDSDEVARFRSDCRLFDLNPRAYGVYLDGARRPDRWLTVDESAADLTAQLHTTANLGIGIARAMLGMDLEIVNRVIPVLDELGVVLTFEIQGPHTPDSPQITELVTWLERNAGAPVGVTLDCSIAMPGLPASYRRVGRELGMSGDVEALLETTWRGNGPAPERIGKFYAAAADRSLSEAVAAHSMIPFVRFGHGQLDDWQFIMPWVRHAHAKYWDWEDAGEHVVELHSEFLELLAAGGFTGSVVSEFGGMAWLDSDGVDIFNMTRRHVGLLRSTVCANE
jgi:hypothetical protein